MDNLAKKVRTDGVRQELGSVLYAEGSAFVVEVDGGELRARRAVSCLVEPRPGDLVLLAVAERASYVLSVLEREEGATTELRVDGDLAVSVPSGRFKVAAQLGAEIVSAEDLSLLSRELDVRAGQGSVVIEVLSLIGGALRAEVERAKLTAETLDTTLERVTERVRRAYRFVSEQDQLRARHIDYQAEGTLALRGKHAVVAAEELVKVDGEQIHVG